MGVESAEFERVFNEHLHFVWRVLMRLGVAESDIPDVCQEVFVVVFKSLPTFEGRSSLTTWIYAICKRVAANQRKLAWRRRETPGADLTQFATERSTAADAQDVLDSKRSLFVLEQLVSQLPPAQREVFMLYEVEELSMQEVAQALECPVPTAFARLYAARRAIAKGLKQLRARRRVA